MTEAVDELVRCLTDDEFRGKMVVVLAGYEADMEAMLDTNPGLKSRFSERIHFDDFDEAASAALLRQRLVRENVPLAESAGGGDGKLESLLRPLVRSDGFGNGRDIDTLAKRIYKHVASRQKQLGAGGGGGGTVTGRRAGRRPGAVSASLQDVQGALSEFLQSRQLETNGQACAPLPRIEGLCTEQQSASVPATAQKVAAREVVAVEKESEEEREEKEEEKGECTGEGVFDGIDSRVLQTLQSFVERNGLNSASGVAQLSRLSESDPEFERMVERLMAEVGMTRSDAGAQLKEWQEKYSDVETLIEVEAAKAKQGCGLEPIWRCAVCGRADMPYIACYVAPFIVRYQKRLLTS